MPAPTTDPGFALDKNSQAAMNNVDDTMDATKRSILSILRDVSSLTSQPFILVGGASLILCGSTRMTTDVDLLVPHNGFDQYEKAKAIVLGQLHQKGGIMSIDLLTDLYSRFAPVDFQAIEPYTTTLDGVHIPRLDVLLGAKVIAHFGRPDGVAGDEKRESDSADIYWISKMMAEQNLRVETNVRDLFVCGPLNMLLVLEHLQRGSGESGVDVFELVGGREFECYRGDKRFEEQAGLYREEIEMGGYSEDDLKILGSRRN